MCVVIAHALMMDRIRAEESMNAATVTSVGSSQKMRKMAMAKQMAAWERQAKGGPGQVVKRPTGKDLAAVGIKVVKRG